MSDAGPNVAVRPISDQDEYVGWLLAPGWVLTSPSRAIGPTDADVVVLGWQEDRDGLLAEIADCLSARR